MLKLINENTPNPRDPRPSKQKSNGFTEPPQDSLGLFQHLSLPLSGEQTAEVQCTVSDEALHRYRQAMHILTQKDRPIPSLDQMQEELKEPDDSTHAEKRIKRLKAQHLDDLQRLYATHAAEYHEEILHRHRSKDEAYWYLSGGENNPTAIASYQKLQDLYIDTRNAACYELHWHDDVARLNYAHQQELSQLRQKKKHLQQREDEERRREDAQFPQNIADWRARPKNAQLRVAKFLTLDKPKQEKMLSDFNWAWRQVQPLVDEFNTNEDFWSNIQSFLAENEVKDPRGKR